MYLIISAIAITTCCLSCATMLISKSPWRVDDLRQSVDHMQRRIRANWLARRFDLQPRD